MSRLLLVFIYCGVLSATPLVENYAAPPAIGTLAVGHPFFSSARITETTAEASTINSLEDMLLALEATMLETAFLAGYPAGVTLERFQGATLAVGSIQPDGVFDRLPLNSAGSLLSAGSGIFFLLMLGVALVEQVQLATASR